MSLHNLLLLPETLLWAWRKVRRCYHLADSLFDQAALAAFELNLEVELESIRNDFADGCWISRPVRPVPQPKKPDKDGNPRLRQYFEISVRDQVAWTAVATVLGPELDRKMPAWSYGNRLYRAAWYEDELQEGRGSHLNIGPYRHSSGYLYRHFKHSWPLYRRHISLTARKMSCGSIHTEELDEGERRALDQSEGLAYLEPSFWRKPASQGDKLYAASLDLMKFYPSIRTEAILTGFRMHVDGFREEALLANLIQDMLQFHVDDSGMTSLMRAAVEPPVTSGLFNGIPTGLFVGGFLANVAMLPLDLKVDELLRESCDIAHFRFVDDHEILSYDFDALINWIKVYARLLEEFEIGAQIEPEKYVPCEIKEILHRETSGYGGASELEKELREKVAKAAEINGRKPTDLMTRTLAQVSMLAATDFDLLSDAGREQRLEQLEWLLLANIPEQEIRRDTRMAFAAARIAILTPALFRPNEKLREAYRQFSSLSAKRQKNENLHQRVSEPSLLEMEKLLVEIASHEREERNKWEALLERHFRLLLSAFHAHPDKARLFMRLIEYCRITGFNGFPSLTTWLKDNENEGALLQCYLGALGMQLMSRHIITACAAINRADILHRERQAARSFISHLLDADLEAFVTLSRKTLLPHFQVDARNAFVAALVLGAFEVERSDAMLSASMRLVATRILEDTPSLINVRSVTLVPIGVWVHWFITGVGSYSGVPPTYWLDLVAAHDVDNEFDWANLRRYPSHLPKGAWARLRLEPNLLASDDEGWLLDAARGDLNSFGSLPADNLIVSAVASRVRGEPSTMSLSEWVAFARTLSPSDPRRSEWTALEIMRQLLQPLFELRGPDADFLDALHPETVRIPLSWRDVEESGHAIDRMTWEGWSSIVRTQIVLVNTPNIKDFRYRELLHISERRWARRLRPIGQLLWGILRLNFMLPAPWNIRGQERGLVEIIARDLECLPISSFTLTILQSCLLPRSIETAFLPQFPTLFGNHHHKASDDSEFDRIIPTAAALSDVLSNAQNELQRSQMTVLEHAPRQLIPVRLKQIGAFGEREATDGDIPQ